MKTIRIADRTLCRGEDAYSFKERIEIARLLDNLRVDTIELPAIQAVRADTLLIKTIASFVKHSTLSVATGYTVEGVEQAAAALAGAVHPRLRVELPVSAVGMEYSCHKKAPKLLELITVLVTAAKKYDSEVEFCALDATRAEAEFLPEAVRAAVTAGATAVSLCDSAGTMLPDDFAAFIRALRETLALPDATEFGVLCSDHNGLGCASAILTAKQEVETVKTAVLDTEVTPLETFAEILKNCGEDNGFATNLRLTEQHRILSQIRWIAGGGNSGHAITTHADTEEAIISLDCHDDAAAVAAAVRMLGYDLSEEDNSKVFEEFVRMAEKKTVGAKELDAIVASTALQVPPTYKLINYSISSGNIMAASAQIRLERAGTLLTGIGMGDGPIDASFLTVEQIIGHHYELDDFQIQAVTEGKEAMGSALVKLRSGGKLYSGTGISTDILGASIRAYLSALNKIVYEEA